MRHLKIEHPSVLDAVGTEYALDRAKVKSMRIGTAVIVLSDMHNTNLITNIMVENKGFERDEPTQYDIDMLNGE